MAGSERSETKKKKKVGILAGGRSNERAVSLRSAEQVLRNLPPEGYDARIIEVPSGSALPIVDQLHDVDVAFIAMHGSYAEDGRVQGFLDMLNIPYTGSGVLASAIGMNKSKTREVVATRGVQYPRFVEVREPFTDASALAGRIANEIGFPCVVKPNESGSSVGVSLVSGENTLQEAVKNAFREDDSVLIEEYINGREVTCGVLGNAHQTELRTLPIVEIVSHAPFFDYHAKYESKETEEICPAHLLPELTTRIQDMAMWAHEALGCDGLTRSDFMIREDGVPYFLEINTIPGLTETSLCPKEARAAGISLSEFLDMQIGLAFQRIEKRR